MTKTFTASALMMLVDEGKVSITDPVEKYLPEIKGQLVAGDDKTPAHAPQRPITITDILTHTSGLVLASEKTLKKEQSLAADVKHIAETTADCTNYHSFGSRPFRSDHQSHHGGCL